MPGRDFLGLTIRNSENVELKMVGISLGLGDQIKTDVAWGVLRIVIKSNARFGLSDRLEVHVNNVKKPAGNDKKTEKTKGRSLDVMSAIKKSIVTVKAAIYCLAYAFIIAMAQVNVVPKYQSYRDGRGQKKLVEDLLEASGLDLANGGGFQERQQFQDHLSDYKIVVFDGLNPDRFMFCGNSLSTKKLHLLYDRDN